MTTPDPLDVLERIHRDVALLRDLAGDSLVITIEPAPAGPDTEVQSDQHLPAPAEAARTGWLSTRSPAAAAHNDSLLEDTLRRLGPEPDRWVAVRDLAVELGIPAGRLTSPLARLVQAGRAEPNGRSRSALRYRVAAARQRPTTAIPPSFRPPSSGGQPADPMPPTAAPPALSARTRKSIERADAEAKAIAALGDPPTSRVFDLVRVRSLTIKEIAAELGEHQAVVAEEVHHLKPWLVQLHDGRLRAVERLREAA